MNVDNNVECHQNHNSNPSSLDFHVLLYQQASRKRKLVSRLRLNL